VPEPSDAVMFQSDYRDLLSGTEVERVAENTYGVCEYLNQNRLLTDLQCDPLDRSLAYHGHCHQKATRRDHHAVAALRQAGYEVTTLDSGCCGMAGSFGYEAEHYSMSQAIADILREQIRRNSGELVVAPGSSCRSQLAEDTETHHPQLGDCGPPHPVELLALTLDV
jgi:Fe-S oxidoreductase